MIIAAAAPRAWPESEQQHTQPEKSSAAGIGDLAWMAGAWRGENRDATAEEHWTRPAGGTMLGCGRTYNGDREQFFEFLKLEQTATGEIVYTAWPRGRGATSFTMTKLAGQHAVFENPQHDMPKTISYTLRGDELVARIEGDEGGRPAAKEFRFKRVKE